MKKLKMKFLCWKESVRKWCIKKLGGYSNLRELYHPSILNEKRGEVVAIVSQCDLDCPKYLDLTETMGPEGVERFVKEKICSDMFEKMDSLGLLVLYRSDEEIFGHVTYKLVLKVIKPE